MKSLHVIQPRTSLFAMALTPVALMAQQSQPNIIMFLVDDMGWQDTSVPFYDEPTNLNKRYSTPNMERLAQMGVKFTQAYATPISSPTRCSLMSGMSAARHRVTNWTLEYNTQTDAHSNVIQLPSWNFNGIQPAATADEHDARNSALITPLPQILKDNGYYTIHCGKAHFGAKTTRGADPLNMGFDVNIAGGANGGPGSYLGTANFGKGSSMEVLGLEKYHGQDIFLTEALTLEAIEAMKTPIAQNKPFYLYMSHYAVHAPYHEDARFTSKYRGRYDAQLNANLNESETRYAALVEGMDKSLGDIMDFLQAQPDVAANTIILFMSDNGGQALNNVRQGTANRDQNYPARAGKGSAFMGGVHEPMMVYWPGVTEAGTINDQRVMIEDFFPSIIEMAGVDTYNTVQKVDGHSFVNVLKNPEQKYDRTIFWHFPNLWGESQSQEEGYGATSSILKDNYHLIYTWETQKVRLYDVKADVGEQTDLAATLPDKVKELTQELTSLLKECDAQRPSYRANGEVIPYPDEAVAVGEAVTLEGKIKLSTEDEKFYYLISDRHDQSTAVGGSYYWTLGMHYNQHVVQVNSTLLPGEQIHNQLFYFLPGSDEKHFRMRTYNDEKIQYQTGQTASNWNSGNPDKASTLVSTPFLQVGTETEGEFVLLKAGNIGYYGVGYGENNAMNNRGTANGAVGIANMKWVVNDYGTGRKMVQNDNGSQYKFTLYNENNFATYYQIGQVTQLSQLQDGDFIVLQNVNTQDATRHGYVYATTNELRTNLTGAYQTHLAFLKNTFNATYVFRVDKQGEHYAFYSLSAEAHIPNNTAKGTAYIPSTNNPNQTFVLTPMDNPSGAWSIQSTQNNQYMNANVGTPVGWDGPHAYNIYKVSKEKLALASSPWYYMATLKMNDLSRASRRMAVSPSSSVVMDATQLANAPTQLWQIQESEVEPDVFALVNHTMPQGSISLPPSGTQTSTTYQYQAEGKHYGFVLEKTASASKQYGGMDRFKIRRKSASGWYVNAAAAGKNFVLNEWSGPEDAGAESGVWSAIIAPYLTQVDEHNAIGSFYAPYPVRLPQGVKACVAKEVVGGQLLLTTLTGNILPAYTPVVLHANEAGYYPMIQTDEANDIQVNDNLLRGTGVAPCLPVENMLYIIEGKVAPATQNPIPPFTACLAGTNALRISIDGNPVSINRLLADPKRSTSPIYNLKGQRVHNPSKGIYIQNQQKRVYQ